MNCFDFAADRCGDRYLLELHGQTKFLFLSVFLLPTSCARSGKLSDSGLHLSFCFVVELHAQPFFQNLPAPVHVLRGEIAIFPCRIRILL